MIIELVWNTKYNTPLLYYFDRKYFSRLNTYKPKASIDINKYNKIFLQCGDLTHHPDFTKVKI